MSLTEGREVARRTDRAGGTITRIVPDVVFDIRRPHRLIERSAMSYRRNWMVIVSV